MEPVYISIDLKSFYASQECVLRGLDPLNTNLVVADPSRTEKTICLAVSPPLKALGVPGRPRLFEVVERVGQINALRRGKLKGDFSGKSWDATALAADDTLAVDYIVAPPQMAQYIAASTRIYQVYLKYIAPEDIHVYSIDEVFLDVTRYLRMYGATPRELAGQILRDVLETSGITATAGIGTNLYLCKVAMDILAKRAKPDAQGLRIAQLDELEYRKQLWSHRPLTDFWRIGPGYARKLERYGMYTMGDVARCSLGKEGEVHNQALLYRLFGVNAELLIDHAWGIEPCTMAHIKAYKPQSRSMSSGQVLSEPYPADKARLVALEMADALAMTLVEQGLLSDQVTLTIGFDRENLTDGLRRQSYHGAVTTDAYGRAVPKHAHGSGRFPAATASSRQWMETAGSLFDQLVDPSLLIRRITLGAHGLRPEWESAGESQQLDLFADAAQIQRETELRQRERRRQEAMVGIRSRFGQNAIFRGMSLLDGATARARSQQIGGHQA